jgi:hypothetical protein
LFFLSFGLHLGSQNRAQTEKIRTSRLSNPTLLFYRSFDGLRVVPGRTKP